MLRILVTIALLVTLGPAGLRAQTDWPPAESRSYSSEQAEPLPPVATVSPSDDGAQEHAATVAPLSAAPTPTVPPATSPATGEGLPRPQDDDELIPPVSEVLRPPAESAPVVPVPALDNRRFDLGPDRNWLMNPNSLELIGQPLGFFSTFDVSAVVPFIHSKLTSGNNLDGVFPGDPIRTPIANSGFAPMFRLEVGYRFEDGLGEIRAAGRYLGAQSTQTFDNFDAAGAAVVTSKLRAYVLDIDYTFTEAHASRFFNAPMMGLLVPGRLGLRYDLEDTTNGPPTMLQWTFGTRTADIFFDSTARGQQVLTERTMNDFTGFGLHFGTHVIQPTPWWRLWLFGKFGCSGMIGYASQTYQRTALVNGSVVSGDYALRLLTGVPTLDGELGFSWVPDWQLRSRFTFAYQVEQWWSIGDTGNGVNAELFLNGLMLRAEFGY